MHKQNNFFKEFWIDYIIYSLANCTKLYNSMWSKLVLKEETCISLNKISVLIELHWETLSRTCKMYHRQRVKTEINKLMIKPGHFDMLPWFCN